MMHELETQVDDLNAQQARIEQRETEIQSENNEYEIELAHIAKSKEESQTVIKNANHISRS